MGNLARQSTVSVVKSSNATTLLSISTVSRARFLFAGNMDRENELLGLDEGLAELIGESDENNDLDDLYGQPDWDHQQEDEAIIAQTAALTPTGYYRAYAFPLDHIPRLGPLRELNRRVTLARQPPFSRLPPELQQYVECQKLPSELQFNILKQIVDSTEYLELWPNSAATARPELYNVYPDRTVFATVHDIMETPHQRERIELLEALSWCGLISQLRVSLAYPEYLAMGGVEVEVWGTVKKEVFACMQGLLSDCHLTVTAGVHVRPVCRLYSPNKRLLVASDSLHWI